jgi:hypothetical protein
MKLAGCNSDHHRDEIATHQFKRHLLNRRCVSIVVSEILLWQERITGGDDEGDDRKIRPNKRSRQDFSNKTQSY